MQNSEFLLACHNVVRTLGKKLGNRYLYVDEKVKIISSTDGLEVFLRKGKTKFIECVYEDVDGLCFKQESPQDLIDHVAKLSAPPLLKAATSNG